MINPFDLIGKDNITSNIPERNDSMLNGSEFLKTFPTSTYCNPEILHTTLTEFGQGIFDREKLILNEFLSGNIPNFLNKFKAITITENNNTVIILVSSDYCSIGNDDDYIRIPAMCKTASKVAETFDCILPTKKIVDEIWKNSEIKLEPKPYGPPYTWELMNSYRIEHQNQIINNQLVGLDKTSLLAGHSKETVLTNHHIIGSTAIYGWQNSKTGIPIQGLNYKDHSETWTDYVNMFRLISKTCICNDKIMNTIDVLQDPKLCYLLSDEGPLKFLRYE